MHSTYSALVLSRLNGPLPADRAVLSGQSAPDGRAGATIAEWAPNWPELQGLSRLSVQARGALPSATFSTSNLLQLRFGLRRGSLSFCEQVNKGVLLLYVEMAPEAAALPPVSADSMEVLERIAVTELEATRFNPNRHREDWDPND